VLLGTGIGAGSPRFWLETEFTEEFSQKLIVVDSGGAVADQMVFPQGRPIRVTWGPAAPSSDAERSSSDAKARPPIAGWWHDSDSHQRGLFVWEPGSVVEWRREQCADDCADAVALTPAGLYYLDGPPAAARLMLIAAPAATPVEVLPPSAAALAPSPLGRQLLVVRIEEGRRSVWLLDEPGQRTP
jgi:hypothetical protein